MNHLDLFSGIGGFSLAAQWVWREDHKIIAFCENDKFCQKVLEKHWPGVPIHDDIKHLNGDTLETIDLITGGFPCQPFSVAGKRKGKEDNRHVWPEMFRVIQETKPNWVIGENVAGIINLELEQVCADLESEGYEVQPFIIPACAVNAPHRRDRVWIVANSERIGRKCRGGIKSKISGTNGKGIAIELERPNKAFIADSSSERLEGKNKYKSEHSECTGHYRNTRWDENWIEVATEFCRVDARIPNRVDRLRSLGNAIVPHVVAIIMQFIKDIEDKS